MSETVLALKNACFRHNNTSILDNVSLEIKQNTLTTIIGKSGSGKSSLLKIMAGLIIPESGDLELWGADFFKLSEKEQIKIRKRMSFVFQNSALISNLSIRENLLLPLNFHYPEMLKKEQDDLIERMLEQVGMLKSLHDRPAQLSFGERKLVSIARALVTRPELVLFDEPLGSLDAIITKKIMELIYMYSGHEWSTVIMVTYSKDFITAAGNRIILLEDRKIALHTPSEVVVGMNKDKMPSLIKSILEGHTLVKEPENEVQL